MSPGYHCGIRANSANRSLRPEPQPRTASRSETSNREPANREPRSLGHSPAKTIREPSTGPFYWPKPLGLIMSVMLTNGSSAVLGPAVGAPEPGRSGSRFADSLVRGSRLDSAVPGLADSPSSLAASRVRGSRISGARRCRAAAPEVRGSRLSCRPENSPLGGRGRLALMELGPRATSLRILTL